MEMKIEPLALPGVDTQRPIVIAGPCSAETEEQVLETAQGLASRGVKIFRAGIWKPRTKPPSSGLAGCPCPLSEGDHVSRYG